MPGVFDKMPKKLTEMQHLFPENLLHLRGETCQIRSVWLANYALVLPDVSNRNPRAYDGCEEQTIVARIADGGRGPPPPNRRGRTDDLADYGMVNDQTSRQCAVIEV